MNESVPEADNKVESNVQDSTEAELVSADNGNQAATSSTYSAPNSATDSTPASTDAPQPSLLVTTFKVLYTYIRLWGKEGENKVRRQAETGAVLSSVCRMMRLITSQTTTRMKLDLKRML